MNDFSESIELKVSVKYHYNVYCRTRTYRKVKIREKSFWKFKFIGLDEILWMISIINI